jgi:hypothetical protein
VLFLALSADVAATEYGIALANARNLGFAL